MATPRKQPAGGTTEPHATPKLGRGIQREGDVSFETSAIHQSGSKAVQGRMADLSEQFAKRKTELAGLLRSASKKRVKKNEPSEEEVLLSGKLGGVAGFPDLPDAAPESHAMKAHEDTSFAESGPWGPPTGSLLSHSASFSMSPIVHDGASKFDATSFFEGAVAMADSPTAVIVSHSSTVHTTETSTFTQHRALIEDMIEEEEEESEGEVVSEVEEEAQGGVGHLRGIHGDREEESSAEDEGEQGRNGVDGREEAPETAWEGGSTPAPSYADVSFRGSAADADSEGYDAHGCSTAATEEKDGLVNGNDAPVAKVLMFSPLPGAVLPLSAQLGASGSRHATRKPFEQPPLVSFAIGSGPSEVRTPLVQQKAAIMRTSSAEAASRHRTATDVAVSGGTRHLSGFISTGDRARSSNDRVQEEVPGSGVRSALAQESGDRDRDSSFEAQAGALEESSPSSYSYIYRENLLHQLKVSTAKNEMLEGKLRDIEQLVDRNYGSISERSRLLTAERNKLERQRASLDDELVATKEELLFIRAQLQNKSARISELETELLDAQRRLMGPSDEEDSQTGTDPQADAEAEEAGEEGRGWGDDALPAPPGMLRINSGVDGDGRPRSPEEVLATVSQEEAAAIYQAGLEMDIHAQKDAREIELLKALLVEQEQQIIEGDSLAARLRELQAQGQAAAEDSALLAEALELAEAQRDELAVRLAAAEQRLREAENAAFVQEARAAELEVELFRSMDAEHERAIEEAKSIAVAPSTRSPPISPKAADSSAAAVPTLSFRSEPSPALPLRKHRAAPLRIPREGYGGLLMLVAFLLVCIWALLLVTALLYLGMLEQRFGVDILQDGGAYGLLFMLRGPRALAATFAASLSAQLVDVDVEQILRRLQGLSVTALEHGTALVDRAVALAQQLAK